MAAAWQACCATSEAGARCGDGDCPMPLVREQNGDDMATALMRLTHGLVLIHRPGAHSDGLDLMIQASTVTSAARRLALAATAMVRARSGDLDGAIGLARDVIDEQMASGEMMWRGAITTALVEALLNRAAASDLEEAEAAVNQLMTTPVDPGVRITRIAFTAVTRIDRRCPGRFRRLPRPSRSLPRTCRRVGLCGAHEASDGDEMNGVPTIDRPAIPRIHAEAWAVK